MNFKKILALTIVVLAIFCCINAASAGFLDFLGGEPEVTNQTFSFGDYSLVFPSDTSITNDTYTTESGIEVNSYIVSTSEDTYIVEVSKGSQMVESAQEYARNMVNNDGAAVGGTYGDWTIIDYSSVENSTYSNYILANYIDGTLFEIQGDDLEKMKSIADTFKKA